MAWIKLYTQFIRNPKTRAFARFAGIVDTPTTPAYIAGAGHLTSLWTAVMEIREDGNLSKYTQQNLADLGNWRGDPRQFANALLKAGLIDVIGKRKGRKVTIHDWHDIALPYLRAKYASLDPAKWRMIQAHFKSLYTITTTASSIRGNNQFDDQLSQENSQSEMSKSSNVGIDRNHIPLPHIDLLVELIGREDERKEEKKSKSITKVDDIKVKYLEAIYLSHDEHQKLRVIYGLNQQNQIDGHGDERLTHGLEILNNYICAKAKQKAYKSHYHVLRGWVLSQCYEDEKRGRLRFSPLPSKFRRISMFNCPDCGQDVPEPEWDNHICNRQTGAIERTTVDDAVKRLTSHFKMPK